MKFTSASVLAATAAVAVAAPAGAPGTVASTIKDGDAFTISIIGNGLPHSKFQAANRSIYVDTDKQNATCSEDVNYATFKLNNGSLFLVTENEPQQIVVDRSGMGQGNIAYTTGAQATIGRNQQRGPFGFNDEGSLVFIGQGIQLDEGFLICPNAFPSGSSVWLGNHPESNPGFNKGCLAAVARPTKVEKPVTCAYTQ